jgi:hypothetical protein
MQDDMTPTEALASIRAAKAEIVRNVDYPVGWDILFGTLIAALYVGLGYEEVSPALVTLAPVGVVFWMGSWWRNRFGWWINAWVPRRARAGVVLMWVILIGCLGLSIWTRSFGGPWWSPLLSGGLVFIVTFAFGRWWMSVYRKELAEEPR